MTLSGSKSKTPKERLLPYIFLFMVLTVFSLLSVVVTMLVTGSVQVINDRFIHFEHINIVTISIAAAIIVTAVIFILKNVKKIFRFIEEQVTHRI
jgi:low affinity Fe/Cu permease